MVDDLEKLYFEYSKNVFYFALSLCYNQDLALDIMQNTFISVINTKENYNGTCSITTWLFSIAKHEYYKILRKNKPYTNLDDIINVSTSENIEDKLLLKEEQKELYKQINMLEENSKTIFLLRIKYNLPFSKISTITGKSENYCRVCFFRSKQQIIKNINNGGLL